MYDTRIARFFAVDPLTSKYPQWPPYQFAGLTPIWASELEGLEPNYTNNPDGSPLPDDKYDIAPIQGGDGANFGWTWCSGKRNQGESVEYSTGDVVNPRGDDDLNKDYFPNQEVSSYFTSTIDGHFAKLSWGFNSGMQLENESTQNEGMILLNRFRSLTNRSSLDPTTFSSSSNMARLVGEDENFVRFTKKIESEALNYYNTNGSLDGFSGLENTRSPAIQGTWFMHTVMGGSQQFDAKIQSISATEIKVNYTIWDRFGAGHSDAVSKLPGLPSMYWLQHNSSNSGAPDNQYVPFIWNVNITK